MCDRHHAADGTWRRSGLECPSLRCKLVAAMGRALAPLRVFLAISRMSQLRSPSGRRNWPPGRSKRTSVISTFAISANATRPFKIAWSHILSTTSAAALATGPIWLRSGTLGDGRVLDRGNSLSSRSSLPDGFCLRTPVLALQSDSSLVNRSRDEPRLCIPPLGHEHTHMVALC